MKNRLRMKKLNKVQNAVYMVGAILVLVGAATYITGSVWSFGLFAVGACAFSSMQLLAGYEGHNFVVRRLRMQQIFGALLLLATAVLMAMHTFRFGFARSHEWMVTLAIACVLELYTAFRIPAELDKEQRKTRK